METTIIVRPLCPAWISYRSGTAPVRRIALSNLHDTNHGARCHAQIRTSRKELNFPGGSLNFITDALSLGHLTSRQDLLECILVQHGYTQLFGLGEFGARFGAGDQIARLL